MRSLVPWLLVAGLVGWIGIDRLLHDAATIGPGKKSVAPSPPVATTHVDVPPSIEAVIPQTQPPLPTPSISEPPAQQLAPQVAQLFEQRQTSGHPQEAAQPPIAPAPAAEAPPPDPMKTESYWKQRLFQSRERVRSAFDQCFNQYSQGGIGDFGSTQYAQVKGSLTSALMGQDQLEEDARREGVPPGWVRFDYTSYPSLTIPDPNLCPGAATCTRTIPHPCSVPDLRKTLNLR